ncbi:hypothetical protein RM533_13145 [Croceicoccus sp. F390]|uniref:Uncharacterized protein n=1 Tax=Croceicoccus esteveae TaxID=3075597 RepID=A0ABU2ZNU5_9SPHN|nr:hypothetical protein [Croceicoccus sp. F390]MDT0577112.1 hypothetical protein [Croceicoccus sp. F390]
MEALDRAALTTRRQGRSSLANEALCSGDRPTLPREKSFVPPDGNLQPGPYVSEIGMFGVADDIVFHAGNDAGYASMAERVLISPLASSACDIAAAIGAARRNDAPAFRAWPSNNGTMRE